MLQPFLLVGVGGSGGKTLRVVRENLLVRLKQAGWTKDDLPEAWQFLHIDVPTHADGNDKDLPPQLPHNQYQGIVAPGLTYKNLDSALVDNGGSSISDAIATWRPLASNVKQDPAKGAGQYRALGRIITLSGLKSIQQGVQEAHRRLEGTGVKSELAEVTRLLGGVVGPGDEPGDPAVFVIASIAGGTGAGAVIDVCDVIRALDTKWADNSFGFLYAPDVFNNLAPEHRKGVRANALATLAELMNGYWNNAGKLEETENLFSAFHVKLSANSHRSGPRYPFLIGASNGNITYKAQNQIYRAMGRSIASLMLSEKLQDTFTAYVLGNWTQTSQGNNTRLPLRTEHSESPFSAIGSARVGLGRDLFGTYAQQHLARSAVERIVEQEEKSRLGKSDLRTRPQLVADIADQQWDGFRSQTGLDEMGPDRNEIVDALRGNVKEAGHEVSGLVTKSVSEQLRAAKKNSATARDVEMNVSGVIRDHETRVSRELQANTC